MSVTKESTSRYLPAQACPHRGFADINAVYNIIQQVEQLRDEHRCGHRKYPAADAALRKSICCKRIRSLKIRKKQGEVRASPCTISITAADFRQRIQQNQCAVQHSHAVRRSGRCSGFCACAAVSTEARSSRAIASCAQSCGGHGRTSTKRTTHRSACRQAVVENTTPASAVVMVFSPRISLTPETVA